MKKRERERKKITKLKQDKERRDGLENWSGSRRLFLLEWLLPLEGRFTARHPAAHASSPAGVLGTTGFYTGSI